MLISYSLTSEKKVVFVYLGWGSRKEAKPWSNTQNFIADYCQASDPQLIIAVSGN